jgi:hypothetical protein
MSLLECKSKVSSFRHKSTDLHDNGYAETVYRTIIMPDGTVKEAYAPYLL